MCTMFLVGKLIGRQVDAFSLPVGSTSSSLVFLQDKLSSRRFLVDSGASVSSFLLQSSCNFDRIFQLAQVSVPILGADFLRHHNFMLKVANQKVLSNSSPGSPVILLSSSLPTSSSLHAALQSVSDLLLEFPYVLSSDGFTASPTRHPIRHHLLTHPWPAGFCQSLQPGP